MLYKFLQRRTLQGIRLKVILRQGNAFSHTIPQNEKLFIEGAGEHPQMKVTFLGVGEAFDGDLDNTSLLVQEESRVLLDCGFLAVKQLWQYMPDPNFLDAIYLSHFHADHYFGLPALLFRMKEDGRRSPLTIITQRGGRSKLNNLMKMAYKISLASLGFRINSIEVRHGTEIKVNELAFEFSRTVHSVPNLAVKVSHEGRSIAYSGDGLFLKVTEAMYKDVDLLVHEAYFLRTKSNIHSCIEDLVPMAVRSDAKRLAFVHINRDERRGMDALKDAAEKLKGEAKLRIIFPREMQEITL